MTVTNSHTVTATGWSKTAKKVNALEIKQPFQQAIWK